MKVSSIEIDEYLKLLGETPHRLKQITLPFEETRLQRRTKDQPWSVNDILAHLRACADVWGGSIERMLAEENPTIPYRHPRQWIKKTNYPELPFHESLQAFAVRRKKLLKILKKLSFTDWPRAAVIKGREHTVFTQVRRMAKHENEHCAQIEEMLKQQMNKRYQLPNPKKGFVHTNVKTVGQRAGLISELLPDTKSIAEICCGNCFHQSQIYGERLRVQKFLGLDIDPTIVEMNKQQGVPCVCGDAMEETTLKNFLDFDIIFFGPPLSIECDGQQLRSFRKIVPNYFDFVELLIGKLKYDGTLVCICPKTTTMGHIRTLYNAVKIQSKDFGLALIHYSYSDVTSRGAVTEPRLKYIELWFSALLGDAWKIQESKPKA